MLFHQRNCAWVWGFFLLFIWHTVSSQSPCEDSPGRCCVPQSFIEIGFHLHFVDSNVTTYIDQGVRLEYQVNGSWQPIRYYTPSLLQTPGSAVVLNDDNTSVTAQFIYYRGILPLQVVRVNEPVLYKEYIKRSLTEFKLRWSQLYTSVNVQQDRASWLIDNITVIQWNGLCTKTLLFENFENSTCSSSEKYKIGNAAENCQNSSNTRLLYFNGYDENVPRRFLVVNSIISNPPQIICENTPLYNRSECPAEQCRDNTRCFPCPDGHVFNSSIVTCIDINECEEARHTCQPPMECINTPGGYECICSDGFRLDENGVNCTHTPSARKSQNDNLIVECQNQIKCNGEVFTVNVRQCCLESTGLSFSIPGSDQCYPCIVYGWLNDTYDGEERYRNHILYLGFRKGGESLDMSGPLLFNVIVIDGEGVKGAKVTADFKILTEVAILNQFVLVSFLEDQIALEYDETFHLKLKARSPGLFGPNILFCDTIQVTITDSDKLDVYFVGEVFLANEGELRIPVVVKKPRRIATPLTARLRPLSIADILNMSTTAQPSCPNMCSCICEIDSVLFGDMDMTLPKMIPFDNPASPVAATVGLDFCAEAVNITFVADENLANPLIEITTYINITDDSINEAEQVFLLEMEVESVLDIFLSQQKRYSLGKIIDDDAIRLGFSERTYEVAESTTSVTVMLIKEDNVWSEQTFSIDISVLLWPFSATLIFPAVQLISSDSTDIQNGDFSFANGSSSLNLQFPPSIQVLLVDLTIYDDTIAEGIEGIILHMSIEDESPGYHTPFYTFPDTRIIIEDDDNITIGFEMNYWVFEWAKMVEVCLRYYNPPSLQTSEEKELRATRYEVQVNYESINGSASSGTDYLPIPPTSVIFNDHYFCKCFNVTVLNNDYLENFETFTINITSYKLLPTSLYFDDSPTIHLRAGSTEIIIEDDDVTIIGFTTTRISISESMNIAVVTLNITGAELEQETIIANISTHDLSANGGLDYKPISDQQLTFSANLLEADIAVAIIDDFLFEHNESLLIKMELISAPFPGLIVVDNVSITIIDNDGVTATLNGRTVSNHDLLYFDEIGYNQSSGLVCDGLASDICCEDNDPLEESGKNGSEPNGIGSWIAPDNMYVRRDCKGCMGVTMETFQVHRTDNSTILYRNENFTELVAGIYRCKIPLSMNISEEEPLIQYVGIFERGKGTLILLKPIELTIVSTMPPLFHLKCATSGGSLTVVYWTRNKGDRLENNEIFEATFVIVDYVNATYYHTLTVTGNSPGIYTFFAQDPFVTDDVRLITDSHDVENLCRECNNTCDEGFIFDDTEEMCIDVDECKSIELNNCSSRANSGCLNTNGSYICQCSYNFVKLPNGNCGISVIALSSIVGSIGLVVLLTAAILAITSTYLHIKKKKMTAKMSELSSNLEGKVTDSDTEVTGLNYKVKGFMGIGLPKELFILASTLELGEPIGQGEFGIVYKAHLMKDFGQRVTNTVAVKTLKGFHDDALVKEMLKECVKMLQFDHPHVLALIGVCVDGGTAPYIVMPFMSNGSLLSYLRKFRKELFLPVDHPDQEEVELTLMKLMDMCIQVAKGMEYLTSKSLIHRDLATRNCMIDMNNVIKVADFGLSVVLQSKDYFRQDMAEAIKLPIKWLAIESLNDCIFSEKSDVWAFGVTCWEIFSGGKVPHATINPINLLMLLEEGYRLEKPVNLACSDEMYSMMLKCWAKSPVKRPTFLELVANLSLSLDTKAGYLDIGGFSDHMMCSKPEDQTVRSPVSDQSRRLHLSPRSSEMVQQKNSSRHSLLNLYIQNTQ